MRDVGDLVGFAGRHADVYVSHLLPVHIAPFGDLLLRRAAHGERLLDLACGNGFASRLLADRFTSCVGVDASEDMARRAPNAVAAIAERLPFQDRTFDYATCVFGWMFFDDHDLAAWELRRVLRPGSQIHSMVWHSLEANPYAHLAKRVMAPFFPGEDPKFYDVAFQSQCAHNVETALARAGFRIDFIGPVQRRCAFPDAQNYAEAYVYGNVKLQRLARQTGILEEALLGALVSAGAKEFGERPCAADLTAVEIIATA